MDEMEDFPTEQEPPKRRGRRQGPSVEEAVEVKVTGTGTPKQRRSPRRAAKLSGKDVQAGISLLSQFLVGLTKHPHWYIPPEEVAPWSDAAADLLNRIPAKWIAGVMGSANIVAVVVGVYSTFIPRLEEEKRLRELERTSEKTEHYAGTGNGLFSTAS